MPQPSNLTSLSCKHKFSFLAVVASNPDHVENSPQLQRQLPHLPGSRLFPRVTVPYLCESWGGRHGLVNARQPATAVTSLNLPSFISFPSPPTPPSKIQVGLELALQLMILKSCSSRLCLPHVRIIGLRPFIQLYPFLFLTQVLTAGLELVALLSLPPKQCYARCEPPCLGHPLCFDRLSSGLLFFLRAGSS